MRHTCLALLIVASPALAGLRPAETGKVAFKAVDDQTAVAERYRLAPVEFEYHLKPQRELVVSGIEIYDLTFPSQVKSPHEANNTVYAEYYLPKGKGPFPGVIVLDIL